MKRILERLFILTVVLVTAVLLIRTFAHVRKDPYDQDEEEEEKEEAVKTPSRASVQNGQTIITLDVETESQTGITVAPLKAITARTEISSCGRLISAGTRDRAEQ